MAVARQPTLHRTVRALRRSGRQKMSKGLVLVIGNWQILEDNGDLVVINQKTGDKTILANRGESGGSV